MNKFIGRQRLIVTTGIPHPPRSHEGAGSATQTVFIKGKVRNLNTEAKRLTLWRTTSHDRSSGRFSKCQSLQKSILLPWWLRTLVCQGSGRAVWVRGHSFHIPTSVCIFSCPETIEGELGSFAPTLCNLIVKHKGSSPHI